MQENLSGESSDEINKKTFWSRAKILRFAIALTVSLEDIAHFFLSYSLSMSNLCCHLVILFPVLPKGENLKLEEGFALNSLVTATYIP